jgi:hypothetical protein
MCRFLIGTGPFGDLQYQPNFVELALKETSGSLASSTSTDEKIIPSDPPAPRKKWF